MRHSHHAPGSATAQADLSALAGWTPSRRSLLGGLLVAGAATAATATGTAIFVPTAATVPLGVSPRMAHLIAEYRSACIECSSDHDFDALDAAITALVNEPPATLADFVSKFSAIAPEIEKDLDFYIVRRLAEDAAALAGRDAR